MQTDSSRGGYGKVGKEMKLKLIGDVYMVCGLWAVDATNSVYN